MNSKSNIAEILNKLTAYKKKYYLNKIVKGLILNIGFILFIILLVSGLEYSFQLNSPTRTVLFALALISLIAVSINFLIIPLYHLLGNGKHLSNDEAAKQIGQYFPEIKDKLLNIIQLNELSSRENSLISASISQKYKNISLFNFKESINIRKSNKSYLPYLLIPSVITILVFMFSPNMITEGSYRVIKFNEDFIPKAPFQFQILNDELNGFKGEDFTLTAKLEGNEIPAELFINKEGVKQKFERTTDNQFKFTFKNIQSNVDFRLEAAGFYSNNYQLKIYEKPSIQEMNIKLDYPNYTGLDNDMIINSGNIIIPEGTVVNWLIQSKASDQISIDFKNESYSFNKATQNSYNLSKSLVNSSDYKLNLFNKESNYNQSINYSIEVIKDKYPEINLTPINDSTYFRQVAIAGEISDDYGFSKLNIVYNKVKDGQTVEKGKVPLQFDRKILNQKYFSLWQLDSLIEENTQIEYYVEVADNDGVNGAKYSKSSSFIFQLPDDEYIEESIKKTSQNTENQIDKSVKAYEGTNQKLEELENILKTKRKLNWEDKKLLEDIINENEKRREELKKIKNEFESNQAKRDRFNKQSPELKEKSEQLESLMEEMLQNENEELMEKIKSLLEEQNQSDEFRESVEDLKRKEQNKLKEMERLMELFKRMEIQYDMKQVGEKLKDLEEKQNTLSEENDKQRDTESNDNSDEFNSEEEKQEAVKDQKELNQEFDKIQEELREIEKRNHSLKQPNSLQDTKEKESEIELNQQNSLQKLQENNKSGASEDQKKSAEEMKEMSEMLSSMQMNMEMEMLQENIDDLRDIVDNLLKLSFRQEELMKSFREVNPSDPRFISLSEKQLAMQDDAQIVEDSLNSLAERVFQIKNFINKELDQMNESMEASVSALRERENGKAIAEQQFAMTAMNNLALMLDDVLEQMQMQMQASMGMGQQSKGNQQSPSLSDMQKSLNQKTKELSQGQREGRQFSEKLGELAAEQAKIRKMMEELQKQLGNNGEEGGKENGGNAGDIVEEMEKIEEELVNKRLNERLIERQQKIVTRLLESEKANQEQEEDEERKGETATDYEKNRIPNVFEEYIEEKKKEIEQLRNVPPNFTPYYKNEINKYYNRLKLKENQKQ
ncbi:DUF4175 family protein [Marivirga arenosa]|uniref:DUF4175 family protein n=1 Tax=Marivirga arenosa TaxID=3059076 RepID=A0AA51NB16_9BACT|nr:DUF4175 family protein [Marivirga sp. ABR2-2]WMN07815.1 DUF4175 family protein [Marivirga sp. ABR2-2]